MIPLDVAAVRLSLALAGGGCRAPVSTGTLAILATWARDRGPETVARWVQADPGWLVAPSVNRNQSHFGASLLTYGRLPEPSWRAYLYPDTPEPVRWCRYPAGLGREIIRQCRRRVES